MRKSVSSMVSVEFVLSFDPGKQKGSNKFLIEEQRDENNKEILQLEFFERQHFLIRLFRRRPRSINAKIFVTIKVESLKFLTIPLPREANRLVAH